MRFMAALLFLASLLSAQVSNQAGALQGVVLDPSRAPVAGAEIRAVQEDTNEVRSTRSRADGTFILPLLPIGPYTLTAQMPGFAPREIKGVLVSVGQTVVQPLDLTLASAAEKVEVVEQAEMLQGSATSQSLAMGYERVEHSSSQGRSYLNFVVSAPGVVPAPGSTAGRSPAATWNLANDSGFSAAGMRSRNNAITIDGTDNRDETTGGIRVAVPVEMIQELRVAGTAISADFGGAAGAIVNIVTRSGGNQWHGHGEFMAQHEKLNARNPEFAIPGRPYLRRLTPGGSGGGPIEKDKTFFAAALEAWWENCDEWSETPAEVVRLFPTLGLRSGLFRAGERDVAGSVKMQHLLDERNSITARYAYSWGRVNGGVQGVEDFSDYTARATSAQVDHSFVAGWTRTLSPTAVNSLTAQLARRDVDITPNSLAPMVQIPGLIAFGRGYRAQQQRAETHYEISDNLSVVRGRHFLSLGGDVHGIGLNADLANRFGGIQLFESLTSPRPFATWEAFGTSATRFRTVPVGVWLNDRIQMRPNLTMEAGLRYDTQTLPGRHRVTTHNAAPRWGLAWSPNANWVLRAGAGLFYDRYPLAYWNDAVQKDGQQGAERYNGRAGRYVASRHFPATYAARVTAGVERLLNRDTSFSVEYTFLRGLNLPRVRTIPGAQAVLWNLEQTARSAYQGVTLSLHRRMTREFGYMLSYTGGVARDDGSDYDEQPMNPADIRRDWGRSRLHQAHRVTASALFEIPWFEEWSPKLEHIHFVPTAAYGSARPLNTLTGLDPLASGAYPLTARPAGAARNTARVPGITSFDMRLFKELHLSETSRLQLGAEGYNILNRANVVRANPFTASLGRPLEFGAARQVQLFAHLEF